MFTTENVKILHVEDDDIDADGLHRAFKKQKISNPIVRVQNGAEALARLDEDDMQQPYVILLDLNMPKMGGIEFLQALRNKPCHKSAVVFVLTTSNAPEDLAAAYQMHVAGYFVKSQMHHSLFELTQLFENYCKVVKLPSISRQVK